MTITCFCTPLLRVCILNIQPVLEMGAGHIEAVEKVRTKQKAIQFMMEIIAERLKGETSIHLAVTHANAEAEALSLLELARTRLYPVETFTCPLSPIIGAHVGPGTLALNHMRGVA